MSLRDNETALRQMLNHAEEARSLITGKNQQQLESDRVLTLAVIRLLEVMGEAASRVSAEFTGSHPQVPWSQIVGLRNRLIHAYDAVDMDILWQIVSKDLPDLISEPRRLTI